MTLRRLGFFVFGLAFACIPLGADLGPVAAASPPTPNYQFGVVEATQALPAAEALGIGWTRVPMFWSDLQPTKGSWNADYTNQDRGLLALASDGIVPVGVVQTVPGWASTMPAQAPDGVPRGLSLPWNNPGNTWGQFMYQLARHYAGLINTWIIGNEISIASGPYHTFDGSVEQMAEMIRVAYLAARAANPAAQIQAPGAPYWYTYGKTTSRLLTDLSQLPGAAQNHDSIDGINLHLYNTLQFNALIFARYRQILNAHGLASLPIWLSEANATPKDGTHAGVTLSQQSDFLIEDLSSSLADVRRVEVYQMKDPVSLDGPEGPTGLVTQGGAARPAYTALKTLIGALSGTEFLSESLHTYRGYSPSIPAVVTFGGVRRLVQVVWDQGFSPTVVHLKAYQPVAEVLSADGSKTQVARVHGQFVLPLAPSTDHVSTNPHDAPIGGPPLFLVQTVGLGQGATPLRAPINSPTAFSGPTPPVLASQGTENVRMNMTQATLTIHTPTQSVVVGGWGTNSGQLLGPSGFAIAPSGTVYVTNSGRQDVVAYDPNGHLRTIWGSFGDGQGQFNGPSGIAVGAHGTVYVSDTLNQRIEAFSPSGTFEGQLATPWPGSLRVLASGRLSVTNQMSGQSQIVQFPTEANPLPAPADVTALAVNADGGYAVATSHSQVMVYGTGGHLIRTWTIPPAYGNRVLPTITSLAWSGHTLYVVDGRYNRMLAIHTALNAVPIQVTAQGLIDQNTVTALPIAASALLGPQSVATQPDGNLVIADTDQQRILEVDPKSGLIVESLAIHDGPYGVASLNDGRLLVTGYYGDTLTELSANGSMVWRAGSPGAGATQLNHPTTVIALANKDIAVWDTGNHRAVIFSPQGTATQWINAPVHATAMSALPSGALLWATPNGLVPTTP